MGSSPLLSLTQRLQPTPSRSPPPLGGGVWCRVYMTFVVGWRLEVDGEGGLRTLGEVRREDVFDELLGVELPLHH